MQRRGLVVDDELLLCEMIGKVLNSAGMEALILTRSTEAPDILDEGKFDVVFLDLHMPSPDGIELARQMRSSRFHRTTSIVLISDDSASECAFRRVCSGRQLLPIQANRQGSPSQTRSGHSRRHGT